MVNLGPISRWPFFTLTPGMSYQSPTAQSRIARTPRRCTAVYVDDDGDDEALTISERRSLPFGRGRDRSFDRGRSAQGGGARRRDRRSRKVLRDDAGCRSSASST